MNLHISVLDKIFVIPLLLLGSQTQPSSYMSRALHFFWTPGWSRFVTSSSIQIRHIKLNTRRGDMERSLWQRRLYERIWPLWLRRLRSWVIYGHKNRSSRWNGDVPITYILLSQLNCISLAFWLISLVALVSRFFYSRDHPSLPFREVHPSANHNSTWSLHGMKCWGAGFFHGHAFRTTFLAEVRATTSSSGARSSCIPDKTESFKPKFI
jgi:hypothetical protein